MNVVTAERFLLLWELPGRSLAGVYEGDPMATIAPPGLETPGSRDNEQLRSPGAEEQI